MNELDDLKKVEDEVDSDLSVVKDLNDLQQKKAQYLGKKGILAQVMSSMKNLTVEARKEWGMAVNKIKTAVESKFETKRQDLENALINKKLESEKIDVTLPGYKLPVGGIHPLNQTIMELEDLYIGMGYRVAEGPEIETDE